jgi:translation initiation factor IF-3
LEKVLINNYIQAKEVRVIGEAGEQLGVMNIFEAIDLAKSKGLDLIQVTEKVVPPVCRIGNAGKYLYSQQKKERKIKVNTKISKLKEIQIGFNIAVGDIAVKAKQAEKFLKEGDKVKITMVLKGREKAMGDLAHKKMVSFLEITDKLIPVKVEREIKREIKGFTAIISKE